MKIILNDRDKDVNERPLKPDFDNIVKQILDRDRRYKLNDFNNDQNNKTITTQNNNNKKSNKKIKNNDFSLKCDDCEFKHVKKKNDIC